MAYIGRDTDKISNVEVLDNITFDGSSSYTLQKNSVNFTPSSANTLLVSIDGVVQAGNFTVSGSTIDFGTAVAGTSTCDFILHYGIGLITTPADGTVTSAKLGSDVTQGITEADQWRLTADIVGVGTADITANLERVDDATFAKIGTGMTESSGIFTFPSTGLYLISASVYFDSRGNDGFGNVTMKVSSDTGSSFDDVAQVNGGNDNGTRVTHNTANQTFVNVTNTSTFQVKFTVGSQTFNDVKGSSGVNQTCFTFIRLGDSQ